MNLKQSDQRISRQDYDWLVAWTHFSQCWGSSWTISRLSLRSPVKPSLWRRWTGRRCPSSRRLRSLVCGCAAFLLRTDVSAGGGESKTESWSSENETRFKFSLVVFCTLIDPEPRGHEDAYSHLWMLCCCCDRFCGMKVLVVENVRLLLLF